MTNYNSISNNPAALKFLVCCQAAWLLGQQAVVGGRDLAFSPLPGECPESDQAIYNHIFDVAKQAERLPLPDAAKTLYSQECAEILDQGLSDGLTGQDEEVGVSTSLAPWAKELEPPVLWFYQTGYAKGERLAGQPTPVVPAGGSGTAVVQTAKKKSNVWLWAVGALVLGAVGAVLLTRRGGYLHNPTKKFPPGSRVRLTGKFLRSTGQFLGSEGVSRWTVQDCDCPACRRGDLVAVNQPHRCQEDPSGYEDIPEDERPKWRHINVFNLEKTK